MLNLAIGVAAFSYGVAAFIRFRRTKENRDAFVLLLLCGTIAVYCLPGLGDSLPTVEGVYKIVYRPVSEYVQHLFGINWEDT
ncbi:hypothetical protein KP806_00945 [Paenibacillus sp. N4]|uniref:hypothetical protein n=1 Tax=Paenibacillus vietnamensis TaxID=2590547 RepID=UPI001CD06401|nr:hypothetical protein [Paenibacillus vietnamensis]MCA0753600.1 hypothetical protein [Paenibacillus vietnamensis]